MEFFPHLNQHFGLPPESTVLKIIMEAIVEHNQDHDNDNFNLVESTKKLLNHKVALFHSKNLWPLMEKNRQIFWSSLESEQEVVYQNEE